MSLEEYAVACVIYLNWDFTSHQLSKGGSEKQLKRSIKYKN